MKRIFLTVVFLLALIVQGLAQSDYCTFFFNGGAKAKYSYRLYLNDKLITTINSEQTLEYRLYSKGIIRLGVVVVNPESGSSTALSQQEAFEARAGDTVYYIASKGVRAFNLEKVTIKEFADRLSGKYKITGAEEDMNKPVARADNSNAKEKGQGTCFLISPDGYFISNYHTVEKAQKINIKGINGDFNISYEASVVGSDPTNDLALLKVNNQDLKFASLPVAIRSTGIEQAEKVYAIGFPVAVAMGEEVKITEGIISSKSGPLGDISKFQISAAINQGNSGGPLIDEQGNLIGVIYGKSLIAESAGYALKASYLEAFLKSIDGFKSPVLVNTIKSKTLPGKIAELKDFVFIVETN